VSRGFSQDIKYALRALASKPLCALTSAAVLAKGDRLVMVYDAYPKQLPARRAAQIDPMCALREE
jgi:hypothetical protein